MGRAKAIRTIEDCIGRSPYEKIIEMLKCYREPIGFKDIREHLRRDYTGVKEETKNGKQTKTPIKGIRIAPSTLHDAIKRLISIDVVKKTRRNKYRISEKIKRKWMFSSTFKALEKTPDDRISIMTPGEGLGASTLLSLGYREQEYLPEENRQIKTAVEEMGKAMRRIKKVLDKRNNRILRFVVTIIPDYKEA